MPGATLAYEIIPGNYYFYKSTSAPTSQFELLGYGSSYTSMSYTNSSILFKWPFSFGDTFIDPYSGTGAGNLAGSSIAGSTTLTATGTGSIILPGSSSALSNVLQVITQRVESMVNATLPASNYTSTSIVYSYYNPGYKFAVLEVNYTATSGASGSNKLTGISINPLVVTGIKDWNLDANYAIYPNPAKDNFSVKLSNTANENCRIEIYTATGQLVKNFNLGNAPVIEEKIALSGLNAGMYLVKTSLGDRRSSKRLLID